MVVQRIRYALVREMTRDMDDAHSYIALGMRTIAFSL